MSAVAALSSPVRSRSRVVGASGRTVAAAHRAYGDRPGALGEGASRPKAARSKSYTLTRTTSCRRSDSRAAAFRWQGVATYEHLEEGRPTPRRGLRVGWSSASGNAAARWKSSATSLVTSGCAAWSPVSTGVSVPTQRRSRGRRRRSRMSSTSGRSRNSIRSRRSTIGRPGAGVPVAAATIAPGPSERAMVDATSRVAARSSRPASRRPGPPYRSQASPAGDIAALVSPRPTRFGRQEPCQCAVPKDAHASLPLRRDTRAPFSERPVRGTPPRANSGRRLRNSTPGLAHRPLRSLRAGRPPPTGSRGRHGRAARSPHQGATRRARSFRTPATRTQ